jgi:hypothetical protein
MTEVPDRDTFLIYQSTMPGAHHLASTTLLNAEPKSGDPLRIQWSTMYRPMLEFLTSLGANFAKVTKRSIRFNGSGVSIDPAKEYKCGSAFTLDGDSIITAMDVTVISYIQGHLSEEEARMHIGKSENAKLPGIDFSNGQLMAVTGPVWFVADDGATSIPREDPPVVCVSIPGINLNYSPEDQEMFGENIGGEFHRMNKAGVGRVRLIWHHALYMFEQYKVMCPVLCAIGCGIFAENTEGVPDVYANALVDVLKRYRGSFECIFVSLVNGDHFRTFRDVFKKRIAEVHVTVAFTMGHGMTGLARSLTEKKRTAGILNPSDAEAVRKGCMGMYLHGKHIALEEVIAVQTTLMLQHIDMNKRLWYDPKRPLFPVPDIPKSLNTSKPPAPKT